MTTKKTTKTTVTKKKVGKKKVGKKTVTETVTIETIEPAQLENDFVILLDSSGSMSSCSRGAVDAFNREVEAIRIASKDSGMITRVSLYTFGEQSDVKCKFFRRDVNTLKAMGYNDFRPDGGTPMWSCVQRAIKDLLQEKDVATNENLSVVVRVITDGQATDQHAHSAGLQAMADGNRTGRFTITFQVPKTESNYYGGHNYKRELANQGVPAGNIMEWDATDQGAAIATNTTLASTTAFYASRKLGVKSVTNYFQPDLSGVSAKKVSKTLTDISSHFKVYEVAQESSAKEFAESKTKREYVIGSLYYQLMKAEKKVQAYKHIVLRDKKTGAIYGGEEARDLLGLPSGVDVPVEPGNHGNYDIFIESTSVNRKLPRGTKVLIDVTQTVNKQPTWDHTAVRS